MEELSISSRHPRTYEPQAHTQELVEERDPEDPRLLNPQQRQAWANYISPKSKTFGNAYQSALMAGYTDSYSLKITTKAWWSEKVRRLNLLHSAETVLQEMIEMPVGVRTDGVVFMDEEGEFVNVPFIETSPALVKIKQDTAKFVAERLGKDQGYSTRTELTGEGGGPIQISPEKKAEGDQAIKDFLEGGK